jgi:hypothetical protein
MAETNGDSILWLPDVEDHDYPAAEAYLSLLFPKARVDGMVGGLKAAPIVHYKAKDLFRASRLSLLGLSNLHVERDRKKILNGRALSPLLLVRDESAGRLIIADGYHRLCAVYGFDEDTQVPCKIV